MFQNLEKEEQPKFKLPSISKSFINRFESCPREAYLGRRSLKVKTKENEPKALKRGKEGHRRFAFKMADFWSKNGGPSDIPTYAPCSDDPVAAYLAEKSTERINPERLVDGGTILGIEMPLSAMFSCKKSASGIVDLAVLKEHPDYGSYIHITDFKTSFKVSSELDMEELFYIFLGLSIFDLPVQFSRISGYSGSYYHSDIYFPEEIAALDLSLSAKVMNVAEIMEGEEIPLPIFSDRCSECEFKEDCSVVSEDSKLEEFLSAKKIAQYQVKAIDSKISNLQSATGGLAKSKHFLVHPKTSVSWGIVPGQGIKKAQVIEAALDIGLYDDFPEIFDIKLTEASAKLLEECSNIQFKPVYRVSTGISSIDDSEELNIDLENVPDIDLAIKRNSRKADD